MIFPLEELISYNGNMYEITAAASRRSYQISVLGDPDNISNSDKIVSVAAHQVFTGDVQFSIEE
ncbi:MAG: DNA-directed RNA polymerase subunit omega [Spirochaetaceae bacterium]|jgi:DNA-directed RNA polymerase subunit omega|nr:DNA-directed RNA polymerase subunit omega [Spirochaetaceae bacterium]